MIDFSVPVATVAFVERVREFIDIHVAPLETDVTDEDYLSGRLEHEVLRPLREKAREAGVYGPQLPREYGGQDLGLLSVALVSEVCGPHALGSLALNCMAPDEATMDLLLRFGTPEQKERWLRPLAEGRIRSCFGMTEPDAGADPRRISSTARATSDGGWVIDGHKVFTSGALGAAVCVVMAVSEPDAGPGKGLSMFLVPTDVDGFEVVRNLDTMGYPELGGHPEVRLAGVEVGPDGRLGEPGAGFAMAQARLGTGRLGHAMRWIGIAQRALDLAAQRALHRETFGRPLADRQAIQWWFADAATQLYAGRLMVLNTAWKVENGLPHRTEVAMVKTFVSETLNEVVDHALQVHGGWGYTTDFPFERWYRDARAARIFDGPSEVHRMFIARQLLKDVEATGNARTTTGDPLLAVT